MMAPACSDQLPPGVPIIPPPPFPNDCAWIIEEREPVRLLGQKKDSVDEIRLVGVSWVLNSKSKPRLGVADVAIEDPEYGQKSGQSER
jgi:hypothetical protein